MLARDKLNCYMDEVIHTPVHKRALLHFLVDGLQVWVSYVDEDTGRPFGVVFRWMEHKYSVSPLEHITEDGGHTYRKFDTYMMLGEPAAVDWRLADQETDPEKLSRLQKIWVAYQRERGETVFST